MLLEQGADAAVRDSRFHGTPKDWAEHGRDDGGNSHGKDYAAVLDALTPAGAP